jgi:hypothetical protein
MYDGLPPTACLLAMKPAQQGVKCEGCSLQSEHRAGSNALTACIGFDPALQHWAGTRFPQSDYTHMDHAG